jgi:hypothetical protein
VSSQVGYRERDLKQHTRHLICLRVAQYTQVPSASRSIRFVCGDGGGASTAFRGHLRLAPRTKLDHGGPSWRRRNKQRVQSKRERRRNEEKKVTRRAGELYHTSQTSSFPSTRLTRTISPHPHTQAGGHNSMQTHRQAMESRMMRKRDKNS